VSVAAVVLAAGEATRFGSPKQRLLLPEVIARLRASSVDEIVVVEGAYPLELPRDTATPGDVPARVERCDDWPRGPGATLRCGLAALGTSVEAAVVVLADGPDLSPQSVERVLAASRGEGGGVVAASYAGQRGHPLVLPRELWADVPDEGLHGRPVRLVPCDDLGAPGDVDEPDDVPARLRR
jgi:nicotine blue oxidoreductase